MNSSSTRREEAIVGIFVIVAAALLIATLFSLTGFLNRGDVKYRAFFKNAGGLRPGVGVSYAGGPPVGRVEEVHTDPHDSSRMEIIFRVHRDVPVRVDSLATITADSPLSDNHLGIVPKTGSTAALAPDGSVLESEEYIGFAQLEAEIGNLAPEAKKLLTNLNERVTELQVTVAGVNDVLNDRNRENLSVSMANVRGVLEENRKPLHATINNVNEASAKIAPLLDDLKKTNAQLQKTLDTAEGTLDENRPDIRKSMEDLRRLLQTANQVTDQLQSTLSANGENIDEILMNFREASLNLRQLTETLKQRPYTLLRSASPPVHEPGKAPKN
jgi:phospholipid/cholesterol/gamma-HCH transport system substrate-binding protein